MSVSPFVYSLYECLCEMLQGGYYFLQGNLDFKQYYDRFADPSGRAV